MTASSVCLGEICEFKYGKSLSATVRKGGSFDVFGSNGIVGHHDEAISQGPTIIVGRKGSLGELNYSAKSCWPIDTTYYVDQTCTETDLRWLLHAMASLRLTELNRAAAIPGLNRKDAYAKRLNLPSLPEQRRIAEILDKADALRAKRREAIAKLDQLLQSVFLEMFGDPVTNPKGWPVGRLADLGELDRGISRHRPRSAAELLDGEHPLIQTGDVARSGGYIRKFNTTYSDVGLAQSKKWPAGTLCITIAANIADTGILTFDACFPDSVVGFTASEASNAEFVQSLMGFLREILEKRAPQVAQKNINLAILRELPIPIPPVGAQKKWASFAASVENMRQSLRIAEDFGSRLFASVRRDAFAGTL